MDAAARRRNERSLYAIGDILHALENGRPAPAHAVRVLHEVSRESARAAAWRMIRKSDLD